MTSGTRLVGVELFSDRAGDSATFYSWLLGPGSGSSSTDWNPVSLLFDHGVCGIHVRGKEGPRASWVPVFSTPDLEATVRRGEAEGYGHVVRDRRTYLTHEPDWLGIVPSDPLPSEIDPEARGSTTVEWQSSDAAAASRRRGRTLGLTPYEVLDDPGDYLLLIDDGVLNLGVVDFTPIAPEMESSWLVYFDVPDIELTLARTSDAGIEVVVPPTDEGYAVWSVLRDPFGVLFALATYAELGDSDRMVRDDQGRVFPIGDQINRR
jgi:predicted enzyme related to lactoylglutathione lyase